ncbi:hypothetical protein ACFLT1_01555 [Bacteroidota bacterium]
MIKVLRRRQIDTSRWNNAIASSKQETIYPYTWYLDACADNWLGLVMNDYECIMPVAYRKKMGLIYTYQPFHCQQLGVFSEHDVDPEIIRMFLHKLKEDFKTGDYAFNENNLLGEEPGYEVTDNTNYVLPLSDPHVAIYKNYTENCRRNLKRAERSEISITEEVTIDEVITLKKFIEKEKWKADRYDFALNLFKKMQEMEKVLVLGARSDDHLIAAVIFAFSKSRGHYLMSASSEIGKEYRAMFLLVDTFVSMYAGTNIKLDFEGSNIASIARFFRGFGAKPEIYQRVNFEVVATRLLKKIKRV